MPWRKKWEEEITKKYEEIFEHDGHFYYLDYVNSFMSVKTYQIIDFKYALLILCQLFLSNADKFFLT